MTADLSAIILSVALPPGYVELRTPHSYVLTHSPPHENTMTLSATFAKSVFRLDVPLAAECNGLQHPTGDSSHISGDPAESSRMQLMNPRPALRAIQPNAADCSIQHSIPTRTWPAMQPNAALQQATLEFARRHRLRRAMPVRRDPLQAPSSEGAACRRTRRMQPYATACSMQNSNLRAALDTIRRPAPWASSPVRAIAV